MLDMVGHILAIAMIKYILNPFSLCALVKGKFLAFGFVVNASEHTFSSTLFCDKGEQNIFYLQ